MWSLSRALRTDGWDRFGLVFPAILLPLLAPWPGLAHAFSSAFSVAGNSVLHLASAGCRLDLAPSLHEDHPWWIALHVTNTLSEETFHVDVDTRTTGYIRLAMLVALACSWPSLPWRIRLRATTAAFGLLLVAGAITLALPLVQILGVMQIIQLGRIAQSILSIGILTAITYPSMAYAIPALLWLIALRMSGADDPIASLFVPAKGRTRQSAARG